MAVWLRVLLAMAGELVLLFLIGGLFPFSRKEGQQSVCENICAGFLVTLAALEAVALPMTWAGASLTVFSYVYGGVLAFLAVASLVLNFTGFFRRMAAGIRGFSFNLAELLMVIVVILQGLYVLVAPAAADASLTVNRMTTDLFHDSLSLFNPVTDQALVALRPSEMIVRWPALGEFFALIAGIDAATQAKLVGAVLVVVLSYMFSYRVFMHLFEYDRTKASVAVMLLCLVNLFFRTGNTPASLLYGCPWSGLSIFVNLMLPAVLLIACYIYEGRGDIRHMVLMVLSSVGACALSTHAFYLFPVVLVVLVLPAMIGAKKLSVLPGLLISLIVPAAAILMQLFLPDIPIV